MIQLLVIAWIIAGLIMGAIGNAVTGKFWSYFWMSVFFTPGLALMAILIKWMSGK